MVKNLKNLIFSKTNFRFFLKFYIYTIFSVFALILLLLNPVWAKKSMTVATWNINNLHEDAGSAIRPGAPIRQVEDYTILNLYRKKIDADIIALQEMGSPQAAERIFPPDQYTVLFSSRYNNPVGKGRTEGDIFTALAIRKPIRILKREEIIGLQHVITRNGKKTWTRRGVAALIDSYGKRFWILAVHLKSFCHGRNLEKPTSIDCRVLSEQRVALEQWTDRKFNEGLPFMILGDFNRIFDLHGQKDHLWGYIDDQEPEGLNLWRLPYKVVTQCPGHEGRYPIDFLVFDDRAWQYVQEESFREILYTPDHAALGNRLSDHCPISVTLSWP
jgi:endonuclease/exonuclease/phosphatase family metal-dependent hydrolase